MGHDSLHQIDLKRMRTVIEVARAEAITTAAQTLGVTQSAVSRTVAELEEALGQRLFNRLPRGIELTDTGQRFVELAKRVLADVDDLIAEVSEASNRVTGRVRIGVTATGTRATAAFATFASRYPDVAIETLHASDQTVCPKLAHGELDLVVGSSRYLERWRELTVFPLKRMHFACMVRKDHPLAALPRPSEVDVLGYPLILPESVELTYSDIGQRYAFHSLPNLKPHYVTNNIFLVQRLLQSTDAFFPMLHPDASFGGLDKEFLLLRDVLEMPPTYVSYARAAQRPRSLLVERLEQVLNEEFDAQADTSTMYTSAQLAKVRAFIEVHPEPRGTT